MTDIRTLFPAYRWRWSADHEPGQRFDPYHVEIPGRYGCVYLHGTAGGVTLQAYSGHVGIFARLSALPGVSVWQRGTGEMTVKFRPESAPAVLSLLHCPRKRPGRSAEQMAAIRSGPRPSLQNEGKPGVEPSGPARQGEG